MLMKEFFCPTLRELPAEAEVISQQLMLRAGMIRKVAAGIYSYLPLGYRVMKKLETIIREELDKAGAQELLMPVLHPAELWKESGRWAEYGPELVRLKDRKEREFCLGPTHEEIITFLVRHELKSYKDLPLNFYQIQTKMRDEIRPRFGVMRAREFTMKDAYSFHASRESLDECYEKMYHAYCNIFNRCDLDYRVVEADTGPIGGSDSHEFMVTADTGEDQVLYCGDCEYAANIEKASARVKVKEMPVKPKKEMLYTPDIKTIAQLAEYLSVPEEHTIKTLIYRGEKGEYMALLRGNDQINEVKLKNALQENEIEMVVDDSLERPMGFVGPVDQKGFKIISDNLVMKMDWGITGANEKDYHLTGVIPGQDFKPQIIADIRLTQSGDGCPHCSNPLRSARGIEVGHIFKLGTKYSQAMKAFFIDADGKERPFIMGCYGIGVGRTVAAAIEQNHDDMGIVWPWPLAPFQVIVLSLGDSDEINNVAENIYKKLWNIDVETLWDNRKERPGVKFNDADLLGIPLRITVGKFAKEGKIEIKERASGETEIVNIHQVVQWVNQFRKRKGE